ncbi:MAG TPA: nitronate monooxygenase [Dermatophilaceae bacterium]|nr:nitronate monooxygenase [Dermatophilaceae bacterium]
MSADPYAVPSTVPPASAWSSSSGQPTGRPGTLPAVIQGGMGVGVSGWRLAHAVSAAGQLGVVSGTALDLVLARRLQDGDPGGHVRRALAAFPVPAVAQRVHDTYFLDGGRPEGRAYRTVPMLTLAPPRALQELVVVANFVEVFLAKEGHAGPVGINYLRKIELPLPFACLGALLAGVDVVLVGAGSPAEIPALLRRLARRDGVALPVRAQGTTSADGTFAIRCSPRALLGDGPPLPVPRLLAIVASTDLATGLAADPATRPDGFVVEAPTAGGHNAPPRGPRRTTPDGEPVYDDRDRVDLDAVRRTGLPFWLAGGQGTPQALRAARAVGAAGVQVGTAFAFSEESGLDDALKRRVLADLRRGTPPRILTDWRASPTGFPFKVVAVAGTLSDPAVAADRKAVCDVGALRTAYKREDGRIDYRCPAEPAGTYVGRKGGREANTEGRRCLCNGLLASAGLPQRRPHGALEPAILTSGDDLAAVTVLGRAVPGGGPYRAQAVLDHLTGAG